jgi:predicted esterase
VVRVRRAATLASVFALGLLPLHARAEDTKPWCSPEVQELSDHVCYYDGQEPDAARKALVIYLHGMYAATPGFQHLQQMALARQAKAHKVTMLFPTAPRAEFGYAWPTGLASQKDEEARILDGIRKAKDDLEKKLNRRFDETFVVGFSSGAYFGSSVAVRGTLDVDGYIILVGGSSWARPASESSKRAPIFVGVSAADKQTASHTRAFAGTLAALHWPYRVEERDVGHTVDWVMLAHGISYLRSQTKK